MRLPLLTVLTCLLAIAMPGNIIYAKQARSDAADDGVVVEVTLSVDSEGVGKGVYTCDLNIYAPDAINNPQKVSVGLEVIGPIIELSETAMDFEVDYDGPNPDDQVFYISNSGGGTLNWLIEEDWW